MANKKFSEFELKTTTSNVSHVVGYDGVENVRITPANFLDTTGGPYLPLAGGTMTGITQFNDHTQHGDQVKAKFGASNDLEIYHDANNSYVSDVGTGNLRIRATDLRLESASLIHNFLIATESAGVQIFFNDAEKFKTTSTGISVTGNGTFSAGSTVSGMSTVRLDNGANARNLSCDSAGNLDISNAANNTTIFHLQDTALTLGTSVGQGSLSVYAGSLYASNSVFIGATGNQVVINSQGSFQNSTLNAHIINANGVGGFGSGDLLIQPRCSSVGSNNIVFGTSGGTNTTTEKMRLDASGDLIVGAATVNAAGSFAIQNNGVLRGVLASGTVADTLINAISGVSNGFQITNDASNNQNYKFHSNGGGMSLIINSSGDVGIGTSTPSSTLNISHTDAIPLIISRSTAGQTAIRLTNGSASNVDLTNDGSDNFKISNAGSERMRIDASGNLGVGTTTPLAKMEIVDTISRTGTTASLIVEGRQDGAANTITLRAKDFSNPTDAIGVNHGSIMRWQGFDGTDFENMGYVFVGAESTLANADAPSYMSFGTSSDGSSSPSEKMRISSGGVIGIGTSTSTAATRLVIAAPSGSGNVCDISTGTTANTNVGAIVFRNSAGAYCGQITVNGGTAVTNYVSASDYRLKEDLQDFEGLDLVSKIPVYNYKIKNTEARNYGVMAHELQEVLPYAVTGKKDDEKMQGVDYSKIVPLLVKSIQELKTEIELLKNK